MRFVHCFIFLFVFVKGVLGAPLEYYLNSGTVTNEQVDATNFINEGNFFVEAESFFGAAIPWDSQNTLNFTNRGVMAGFPGFRVDYLNPSNGVRLPAQNFFNDGNASIEIGDGFTSFSFGGSVPSFFSSTPLLTVNAQNILNRGSLSMDANGLLRLEGQNVDLAGSRVIVRPIGTFGNFTSFGRSSFFTETNFFPDPGIYDSGFAIGSVTNFNPGSIVFGGGTNLFVSSPFFTLTNDFRCPVEFFLPAPQTYVLTNRTSPTNINIQVIAVQTPGTNITAEAGWLNRILPGINPTDTTLLTAAVALSAPTTDLFTGAIITNRLYVLDQLGSSTNQNLLENLREGTLRPAPIIITRYAPFGTFFIGTNIVTNFFTSRSNTVLTAELLSGPTYSNTLVTNAFTGYAAVVESAASRLPSLPDVDVSFSLGRVEIGAGNLNLENARVRGEGLVKVVATNLLNSAGALIDSAKVQYDIGSVSNVFNFQNFTRETVDRFGGSVVVYSSLWTNIVANPDTNQPITEVTFHVTLVDATDLHTTEMMEAYRLRLSAANGQGTVRIQDDAVVTSGFQLNARGVENNGKLSFAEGMTWTATNSPSLLNITNNGTMQLNGVAQFHRANFQPLNSFVNRGELTSFSFDIRSDYFENTGLVVSTNYFLERFTSCLGITQIFTNSEPSIGPISITANNARLYNGTFFSYGDVKLAGGTYKLDNYSIFAGGRLFIDAGGTFTDTGAGANNIISTANGVQMSSQIPTGDLFGTTIAVFGRGSSVIDNSWAARDLGPFPAGFQNNLAIGSLFITGFDNDRFYFTGTHPGSSMYVDVLNLSGSVSTNLESVVSSLRLSNMNIYYATVNSDNPEINAESLDNLDLGGGRLIWVRTFAGPNSSVDVQLPGGEIISVNEALRNSLTLDSDADGIPNGLDPTPFVGPIGILPNDQFSQARPLPSPSGTIQLNTEIATREIGEPEHAGSEGGRSVWFTFQAPANGLLLLTTAGSSYDTLLAMYTGTSLDNLVEVASNDDVAGLDGQSEILQTVRAGQQFYIAVDGFEGASGLLNFSYNFTQTQNFPVTATVIGNGSVAPSTGELPLGSAVSFVASPAAYFQFLQFETPSGEVISTENPLTLPVNGPINIVARFVPIVYTETFDSGSFDNPGFVSTTGWSLVQTRLRGFVAASVRPPNRTTNSLVFQAQTGAGQGEFEYRVSTEPQFDRLEFYVNGFLSGAWSGEAGWTNYTFNVPAGLNRLEWRYVKDAAFAEGEDSVFINNLRLPNLEPEISASVMENGTRVLTINGVPNRTVLVEASTDLRKWVVLGTVQPGANGTATFQDAIGKNTQRFYRVNAP